MDIGHFFSLVNAHPWAYAVILLEFRSDFHQWLDRWAQRDRHGVTTRCLKPKSAVLLAAFATYPRHPFDRGRRAYLTDFGSVAKTIASLVNFDTSTEPLLTMP
jgi:hypothetical protein